MMRTRDWEQLDIKPLEGLRVDAVEAGPEKAVLRFVGGRSLTLELEGDCCSSSYFTPEALEELRGLAGKEFRGLESRDEASKTGAPESDASAESISWHFLVVTTDAGHHTIDWRNDSNGYYDGSVVASLEG